MPARFTSLMSGHYPAAAVPAQPDLAALAGAALDELADAVGAEVGALWGAREEGGELVLLAARGLAAVTSVEPVRWALRRLLAPRDEMLRAFNMGVGMIVVCREVDTQRAIEIAGAAGEPHAFRLGRIVAGWRGVAYV